MIAYQKKAINSVSSKQWIVDQRKLDTIRTDLEKIFKYYKLSLYNFSLASMMEIMLSGNFKEDYILKIKNDIKTMSDTYREQFTISSLYLEKNSNNSIETNIIKGIGTVSNSFGKFIGNVPVIKEGPVDEFLQKNGTHLKQNAIGMEKKAVKEFSSLGNPETGVLEEKMDDMIQIFNHTSQICCDKEKIYLMA